MLLKLMKNSNKIPSWGKPIEEAAFKANLQISKSTLKL